MSSNPGGGTVDGVQTAWDFRPAPQPLRLVQQFLNTRPIGPIAEQLGDPSALDAWRVLVGLPRGTRRSTRAEVAALRSFRDALHRVLLAHTDGAAPDELDLAQVEDTMSTHHPRVDFAEPRIAFRQADMTTEAAVCAALMTSALEGLWPRLRACPGAGCGLVFYDTSRGGQGRWCTPELCGNRHRVSRYRGRQTPATEQQAD